MTILAFDCSSKAGSVACLQYDQLLLEHFLPTSVGSAQALAPAIQHVLAALGRAPKDVQLIATTIGPGSFTGLRVGIVTAKCLAYALEASLLGVDTLEAIAERAPPEVDTVAVVQNAQRGDVALAQFKRDANRVWQASAELQLVPTAALREHVQKHVWLTGPGVRLLTAEQKAAHKLLPEELWECTASAVGKVAGRRFLAGERADLWTLSPKYVRLSYAEEKAVAKP